MNVPFVDLRRQHDPISRALHDAAGRVIDSANYLGGEEVRNFEKEMARWQGVPEICGVACATSGLFAVLRSLGIGSGDEVITTVHTAIATAEAISLTGARVVFCDISEDGFNLDVGQIESKITPRTRAVIPVHLYGQPVDIDAVMAIARKHRLLVVEDCAQAQGARIGGRFVGTIGDAAVFSFFPSKPLGGFGDGGAVSAREPELMKRIRMFSNHGRAHKFLHEFEGINSRLDAMQAALLRVCLPHVHDWNAARRAAAGRYNAGLAGVPGLVLPSTLAGSEPVYHVYVVLVPDRDDLQEFLKKKGIETGVHYPCPLNTQPAYARFNQGAGHFPRAEHACAHMLSLPVFPGITEAEIGAVCDAVREYFSG